MPAAFASSGTRAVVDKIAAAVTALFGSGMKGEQSCCGGINQQAVIANTSSKSLTLATNPQLTQYTVDSSAQVASQTDVGPTTATALPTCCAGQQPVLELCYSIMFLISKQPEDCCQVCVLENISTMLHTGMGHAETSCHANVLYQTDSFQGRWHLTNQTKPCKQENQDCRRALASPCSSNMRTTTLNKPWGRMSTGTAWFHPSTAPSSPSGQHNIMMKISSKWWYMHHANNCSNNINSGR